MSKDLHRLMELEQMLQRRIVILDVAMGTMIQAHKLQEADFQGQPFATHPCDLKGCNNLLSITQPAIGQAFFIALLQTTAQLAPCD